jgi:tripartite-type tricarboxylate transporter receptor subunit TctC
MGSGAHIRMEAFKAAAGIDLMHVPFQGSSPAFTALLGAHIDAMIVGVGLTAAQHQGGKVRVLAVDSKERDPSLPEVPTFAEQGLSIDLTFWNGVVAPAKTPPAVLDTLNKAINEITGDPQVRREMETAGMVVNQPGTAGTGVGLPQVRSFYENEYARWGKVIRDANISATE